MAATDISVEELVGKIERGELRLPEMQRRYVWTAPQVRDLLDSLYRGYPSGTILVWETDDKVSQQEFAIAQQTSPPERPQLLLDGQQRLTSLSAIIRGEAVTVRKRKRPIEILFNLKHPKNLPVVMEVHEDGGGDENRTDDEDQTDDEDRTDDEADSNENELQKRFEKMTFVVATNKLEQLPHWVKVSEVFKSTDNTQFLIGAGVKDLTDPRAEKYAQRLTQLRGILKYKYRMNTLSRSLDYNEVTEIFVRVNSRGTKLRGSDLALAQITAKWSGARKIFEAFQEECANAGFELELGLHLRNLVVFATGQSDFRRVGDLAPSQLESAWKVCTEGMYFALNFLKNNVGIDSPALLASPSLIVALSYYGHKCAYNMTPDEEKQLRYWALAANTKGRYSRGSTETLLDQDLTALEKGGGIKEMLARLQQQTGRLDIEPEDLESKNQLSALFKTMFLAFRADGACDWISRLKIALGHRGNRDCLQFHHIFPKAALKDTCTPREADEIANLAFIGGRTNRKISDKPPSEYFPKLDPDALKAQCIPMDEELWKLENYKEFLAKRRELISERLNAFLQN